MTTLNIYPAKVAVGVISGFIGVCFQTLLPLFVAVLVFEVVDFTTGVWKSAVVARRNGSRFAFESVKAWRTIYKVLLLLVGIVLAEMLDGVVSDTRFRLANYFTAFCCGVEFWSFLENAAVISNHPIFRKLRKYMKLKVEETAGLETENIEK